MARRMVFLDRDGTINVDAGYVHRWEQWRFTQRAAEALRILARLGFGLAVVTNQSGIARGLYAATDVDRLHEQMCAALRDRGVVIDAIAFCPHGPDEACGCRKPQPGLARQIEAALGEAIDYEGSWMIGDRLSDLQFGRHLGMRTVLITPQADDPASAAADLVAETLYAAARQIRRRTSFA